jgi:hypothetical protein
VRGGRPAIPADSKLAPGANGPEVAFRSLFCKRDDLGSHLRHFIRVIDAYCLPVVPIDFLQASLLRDVLSLRRKQRGALWRPLFLSGKARTMYACRAMRSGRAVPTTRPTKRGWVLGLRGQISISAIGPDAAQNARRI